MRVAETERTYLAAGPPVDTGTVRAALRDGLDAIPRAAALDEPAALDLDAVYFDTADLRLAAHGITLRRRTGGPDAGWHLKLPTGRADTRTEVRAGLAAGTARTPPKSLTGEVAVHTRGRRLERVARIVNHRERTHLSDADGTVLAEIAHDHVTAGSLHWTETEVELLDGTPRLLDAVEELLTAAGLRRAELPSKLRRALGDRVPDLPRPPAEPDTAGHAILRHLHRRITDIVEQDPLVRRDEPDSVHRMRVATRRVRSALKTYRRELDRTVTDPIGDELKWLAGVLGAERDREVLDERLTALSDDLPPQAATAKPGAAPPPGTGGTPHSRSRERLLRQLRGRRYYALLDRLDALLADPPLRPAAAAPAREALTAAVRREHRRLAARVRRAKRTPAGTGRDLALHDARKAAKRARYAAESALPVLGKPARRHRDRLTRIQELLGEHQDSVMSREAIVRRAQQARAAGRDTFGYGVMFQVERDRAAAAEAALPAVWRRADRGPLAG